VKSLHIAEEAGEYECRITILAHLFYGVSLSPVPLGLRKACTGYKHVFRFFYCFHW
jgi:hypothetical protein